MESKHYPLTSQCTREPIIIHHDNHTADGPLELCSQSVDSVFELVCTCRVKLFKSERPNLSLFGIVVLLLSLIPSWPILAERKTDDNLVVLSGGSCMIPRMMLRNTRHAIALASAKYAEPSKSCNSPGMLGDKIKAIEIAASPIVALVSKSDQIDFSRDPRDELTNNMLGHLAIKIWINGVGHRP